MIHRTGHPIIEVPKVTPVYATKEDKEVEDKNELHDLQPLVEVNPPSTGKQNLFEGS